MEEGDEEMGRNGNSNNQGEAKATIYLPGQPLKEDEELVYDESVYVMLHEVHTGKNATPRGQGYDINVAINQKYGVVVAQLVQRLAAGSMTEESGFVSQVRQDELQGPPSLVSSACRR